jgi:hypothetical protein
MKVAVIACLEPEHLGDCLRALGLWTDRADVIVVNNGNTRQRADAIRSTCERFGVEVLRPHAIADGRNTIFYLHEALKSICRSHPDETILKVDEDILIAPERPIAVEPHTFWVPAVTINNYTSKLYLRALWPELFEACCDHAWIWHEPHPVTRRSLRLELLRRF